METYFSRDGNQDNFEMQVFRSACVPYPGINAGVRISPSNVPSISSDALSKGNKKPSPAVKRGREKWGFRG